MSNYYHTKNIIIKLIQKNKSEFFTFSSLLLKRTKKTIFVNNSTFSTFDLDKMS